jgi:hypothetical protein
VLKLSLVLQTALKWHFSEQHGIKTSNKERNGEICCGQDSCTLRILTFANFPYHLSVCEKNFIILEDDSMNFKLEYVDQNFENDFMDIDLPTAVLLLNLKKFLKIFHFLSLWLK